MKSTFADSIEFNVSGKLSGRENEILHFAALGLTNQEIGKLTFISPETVKSHIKNLLWKMNARNRPHLVLLAWEQELFTTRSIEATRFRFQQSRHLLGEKRYARLGGR